MVWGRHVAMTALHMVQGAIGYALMLIVMTYNVWIGTAVVTGSVIGYFLLAPETILPNTKHNNHK